MTHRFRVWDREEEEMYTPPYPDHVFLGTDKEDNLVGKAQRQFGEGVHTAILPDVMHYTGLDDAEGTSVYQKDILDHPKYGPVVVKWMTGGFKLMVPDEDIFLFPEAISQYRKIGNVYETPELLD